MNEICYYEYVDSDPWIAYMVMLLLTLGIHFAFSRILPVRWFYVYETDVKTILEGKELEAIWNIIGSEENE